MRRHNGSTFRGVPHNPRATLLLNLSPVAGSVRHLEDARGAPGRTRTCDTRFRNRAEKVHQGESSPLNWPLWEWPSTESVQRQRMSSRRFPRDSRPVDPRSAFDAVAQWSRLPPIGTSGAGVTASRVAQPSLKFGLWIRPRMQPSGVRTVAVTMPSPTSATGVCSVAPDALAVATAWATSGTPQ